MFTEAREAWLRTRRKSLARLQSSSPAPTSEVFCCEEKPQHGSGSGGNPTLQGDVMREALDKLHLTLVLNLLELGF